MQSQALIAKPLAANPFPIPFVSRLQRGYTIQLYQSCHRHLFRDAFLGFAFDLRSDAHVSGMFFLKTSLGTLSHILNSGHVYRRLMGEVAEASLPSLTLKTEASQQWGLQGVLDLCCHDQGFQGLTGHLRIPVQAFNFQFDFGYERGSRDAIWKVESDHRLHLGLTLALSRVSQTFGEGEFNALFDHALHLASKKESPNKENAADQNITAKKIKDLETKNCKQKTELSSLRKEETILTKELAQQKRENQDQKKEIEKLKERPQTEAEVTIAVQNQELAALRKELEEKNKWIGTSSFRSEKELREIITTQKKQMEAFKKEIQYKDQTFVDQEIQLSNFKAAADLQKRLEEQNKSLNEEMVRLRKAVTDRDQTVADQEIELKKIKKVGADLQKKFEEQHKSLDEEILQLRLEKSNKKLTITEQKEVLSEVKFFLEMTKKFNQAGFVLIEKEVKSVEAMDFDQNQFELRPVVFIQDKPLNKSDLQLSYVKAFMETAQKLAQKGLIIIQKDEVKDSIESFFERSQWIQPKRQTFDEAAAETIRINKINSSVKTFHEKCQTLFLQEQKLLLLKAEESLKKTRDEEERAWDEGLDQLKKSFKDKDEKLGEAELDLKCAKYFAESAKNFHQKGLALLGEAIGLSGSKESLKNQFREEKSVLGQKLDQLQRALHSKDESVAEGIALNKTKLFTELEQTLDLQEQKLAQAEIEFSKEGPLNQEKASLIEEKTRLMKAYFFIQQGKRLQQDHQNLVLKNVTLQKTEEAVKKALGSLQEDFLKQLIEGSAEKIKNRENLALSEKCLVLEEEVKSKAQKLSEKEVELSGLKKAMQTIKTVVDQQSGLMP